MSTQGRPSLVVMGRRVRPLERIAIAAELFGLSRSTAYRMAATPEDPWPLVGPESSRWVLMIPLLERYGLPYEIEQIEAPRQTPTGGEAAA